MECTWSYSTHTAPSVHYQCLHPRLVPAVYIERREITKTSLTWTYGTTLLTTSPVNSEENGIFIREHLCSQTRARVFTLAHTWPQQNCLVLRRYSAQRRASSVRPSHTAGSFIETDTTDYTARHLTYFADTDPTLAVYCRPPRLYAAEYTTLGTLLW